MASAGVQEEPLAVEPATVPDQGYRQQLTALLGLQAVAMWSVGRQTAYEQYVMDGPSLEHWVRTSDAWAEVERNIWEFGGLLGHLGVKSWEELPGAAEDAGAVAAGLEGRLDLQLASAVLDRLGTELARAATSSSYAPLARTARLLAMSKHGSQASGVVSLRDLPTHGAATLQLRDRAPQWLALAEQLGRRYDAAQFSGGAPRGLAGPVDVDGTLRAIRKELDGLLEARS